MRKVLEAVQRSRKLALYDAQRELGQAAAAEADALRAVEAIRAAVAHEAAAAAGECDAAFRHGTFAAWRARMQDRLRDAEAAHRTAAAAAGLARQAVGEASAGLKVVEEFMTEKAAEEAMERRRIELGQTVEALVAARYSVRKPAK